MITQNAKLTRNRLNATQPRIFAIMYHLFNIFTKPFKACGDEIDWDEDNPLGTTTTEKVTTTTQVATTSSGKF